MLLPVVAWIVVLSAAGLFAWRKVAQHKEGGKLQAAHPAEPWLWRRDWAERTSREAVDDMYFVPWILAGMVIALTILDIRDLLSGHVSVFGVVGVIAGPALIGLATYVTLRQRKFGQSVCRMERVPIAPGDVARGEVHCRFADVPADGFDVGLYCIHIVFNSSGKSSTESTLWHEERKVPAGAVTRGLEGIRIPFRFDVPENESPTDRNDGGPRILWRLSVRAKMQGIDYSADYQLPVFARIAEQRP